MNLSRHLSRHLSHYLSPRPVAASVALASMVWLLTGCAAKPGTGSAAQTSPPAPVIQSSQALTRKQKTQQRDEITQYIQKLTPQQRVEYFKAHPEAVQALKP